jgi:hypothetical protein
LFEGVKKDKLELEALRDQLKRFFDHEYKRTFILFPPILKRPKKHNKPAYYDYNEESNTNDCNS